MGIGARDYELGESPAVESYVVTGVESDLAAVVTSTVAADWSRFLHRRSPGAGQRLGGGKTTSEKLQDQFCRAVGEESTVEPIVEAEVPEKSTVMVVIFELSLG